VHESDGGFFEGFVGVGVRLGEGFGADAGIGGGAGRLMGEAEEVGGGSLRVGGELFGCAGMDGVVEVACAVEAGGEDPEAAFEVHGFADGEQGAAEAGLSEPAAEDGGRRPLVGGGAGEAAAEAAEELALEVGGGPFDARHDGAPLLVTR
jgi:hypothetical protein